MLVLCENVDKWTVACVNVVTGVHIFSLAFTDSTSPFYKPHLIMCHIGYNSVLLGAVTCLWIPIEILTWLTAKSISIMTSSSTMTRLCICFIYPDVCMFVACWTLHWYHFHCCVWIKLHALCSRNQTHGWGWLLQCYRQALARAAFMFPCPGVTSASWPHGCL